MAVSTRELMLLLRARDEASKVLTKFGTNVTGLSKAQKDAAQASIAQGKSLVTIGAALGVAGAAGLAWLNNATKAAQEYNQQSALTLTQTDGLGVSLNTVKQIGMDVAGTIPVPFKEIQGGLYDIFSSMDVSVPQAKNLLTDFSKASVAGQVDLQTAARGTIAILNAWRLPASQVNQVNDVMFQLVRKGVGTYQDFATSIGRAIPSTVRAGGSIQDLAGMMAFMTRNGLSSAQAATSAARAYDALSNPKTAEHMKDIGINVRTSTGEFKPMVEIIKELNAKMKDMTAPQRAAALQQLFLGSGGTIQARRFFDLAIPGYKQLNTLTGDMVNSKGAMSDAYNTMFQQPQTQIQLLNNKYEIMKTTVGQDLIPVKMKLVDAGLKLLSMWNNLSPSTQKHIAIAVAITSAFLVLAGIITALVGTFLLLSGAAILAGTSLGAIAVTIGLIIAVVVAVAIIVVLIIKYHTQIWDFMVMIWGKIEAFFVSVWQHITAGVTNAWNAVASFFTGLWSKIKAGVENAWNAIIAFFQQLPGKLMGPPKQLGSLLLSWASTAITAVKNAFVNGWNAVLSFFKGLPAKIIGAIPNPAGLLSGIGSKIMGGLISGIDSKVSELKNKLSSVTNLIPSWKGPASKDRKLLHSNGQLIMKGLNIGLQSQVPSVRKTLQQFTKQIPNMAAHARPVVSSTSSSARAQNSGGGTHQTFNITTQEIDPRKHAADLGVLIAGRLG